MTLVLKGDASYFDREGTQFFSVELEDLITIHIMEPANTQVLPRPAVCARSQFLASSSCCCAPALVWREAGTDEPGGRGSDRPSTSPCCHSSLAKTLTETRPLRSPSTASGGPPRLTRRRSCWSIARSSRPARRSQTRTPSPASSAAMCRAAPTPRARAASSPPWRSLLRCLCPGVDSKSRLTSLFWCVDQFIANDHVDFMENIFTGANYSARLANGFMSAMRNRYNLGDDAAPSLNNRYTRAYWINPGYEWTPTQTGGASIFTVSQRIMMFALIGVDEGIDYGSTNAGGETRRRKILQVADTGDKSKGNVAQNLAFNTDASKVICEATPSYCTCGDNKDEMCESAPTTDQPTRVVKSFKVTRAISVADACKPEAELSADLKAEMEGFMALFGQGFDSVAISGLTVNKNGVSCERRADGEPTVDYTTTVTFKAGEAGTVDLDKIQKQEGIRAISCTSGCGTGPGAGGDIYPGSGITGAASAPAAFSALLAVFGAALALRVAV
eukprot:2673245-Rhodomonas_salina.2